MNADNGYNEAVDGEDDDDVLGTVPAETAYEEKPLVKKGWYDAVCTDVKVVAKKADRLNKDQKREDEESAKKGREPREVDAYQHEWHFTLVAPGKEHDGFEYRQWTSRSFHPRSGAWPIVCALYRRELDEAETVKKSKCVGQPCRVKLKEYEKADGHVINVIEMVDEAEERQLEGASSVPVAAASAPTATQPARGKGDSSEADFKRLWALKVDLGWTKAELIREIRKVVPTYRKFSDLEPMDRNAVTRAISDLGEPPELDFEDSETEAEAVVAG
jgi:hypothetical protein